MKSSMSDLEREYAGFYVWDPNIYQEGGPPTPLLAGMGSERTAPPSSPYVEAWEYVVVALSTLAVLAGKVWWCDSPKLYR